MSINLFTLPTSWIENEAGRHTRERIASRGNVLSSCSKSLKYLPKMVKILLKNGQTRKLKIRERLWFALLASFSIQDGGNVI